MILWLLPWWWPSKGREMTQIGRVMFCTEIGPIYQIGQQGYVSIWFEKSGKVKKGCVSNEQLPNWPAKQAVIAVCQWHSYLGYYYISIQGNRAFLLKGCCFISMKGGTALCRGRWHLEKWTNAFLAWSHQKDSSQKNSLLKSHILGYDGVWYSSFWSEGSGSHLNWQN